MNEEECKELMGRVLELDQIVHEQQLGITYRPPNLSAATGSSTFQ